MLQCSAGIDFVPSDLMTLDPQQTANISFEMHSIYSVGTINKCDGIYREPIIICYITLYCIAGQETSIAHCMTCTCL